MTVQTTPVAPLARRSTWAAATPPASIRKRQDASLYRNLVIGALFVVVMMPVGLIIYQSFLSGAFFYPSSSFTLDAYRYILTDPTFWTALRTTALLAVGMVAVAVPLGSILAFLLTRTAPKFRRGLEILVLVPMFISSIVLGFGYVVAIGPTGFVSLFVRELIGFVPWNGYALGVIIMVAGLSHVPHVYRYVSSAMRDLPSDLVEAARSAGAGLIRVLRDVTLPMVLPASVF